MEREEHLLRTLTDALGNCAMRQTLRPNDPARIVEVGGAAQAKAVEVVTEDRVAYHLRLVRPGERVPPLTHRGRGLLELAKEILTQWRPPLADTDRVWVESADFDAASRTLHLLLTDESAYQLAVEEITN